MSTIIQIKKQIDALNFEELYQLEEYLLENIDKQKQDIIEVALDKICECIHCKCSKIIKWGNSKEVQRFMCKKCNRTFTHKTGSILHQLKKVDGFVKYSMLMFSEGINDLGTLAKRIGVSGKTALDWRHKILISLGSEAPVFKKTVEMDGVWFRYSQKGRKGLKYSRKRGKSSHQGDSGFQSKVLIAKERKGVLDMSLIKIGRLSKKDIERRLSGKFETTSILVSDKHRSISSFANSENIKHESFKASEHVRDKIYHVQTINNIAGSLDTNINRRLRGVSTKYLQNYVTWAAVLENHKDNKQKVKEILTNCFSNKKGWDMFTNIEKLYKFFIIKHSVRTYRCPTKKHWKSQFWNFKSAELGAFL